MTLGISFERNHMILSFYVWHFTQWNVFRFHPFCSMCQNFIPFNGWIKYSTVWVELASQVVLVVKNLLANAGDRRDMGSIPGLGRSPGGEYLLSEPWDLTFLVVVAPQEGRDFSGGSDGKESACNEGELGLIPVLGRSSGEGNGNPLQYCCLENPMDRGAWWATVCSVSQKWLSMHARTHTWVYPSALHHHLGCHPSGSLQLPQTMILGVAVGGGN